VFVNRPFSEKKKKRKKGGGFFKNLPWCGQEKGGLSDKEMEKERPVTVVSPGTRGGAGFSGGEGKGVLKKKKKKRCIFPG